MSAVSGHRYYISFVDHYSKYVWLYPLINKSDAFSIFLEFKIHVEIFLDVPLKHSKLMMEASSSNLNLTYLLRVLLIAYHVHTLVPKTALQKENTATLLRPASLSGLVKCSITLLALCFSNRLISHQ